MVGIIYEPLGHRITVGHQSLQHHGEIHVGD
jgi:hypothetical protein